VRATGTVIDIFWLLQRSIFKKIEKFSARVCHRNKRSSNL